MGFIVYKFINFSSNRAKAFNYGNNLFEKVLFEYEYYE